MLLGGRPPAPLKLLFRLLNRPPRHSSCAHLKIFPPLFNTLTTTSQHLSDAVDEQVRTRTVVAQITEVAKEQKAQILQLTRSKQEAVNALRASLFFLSSFPLVCASTPPRAVLDN